MKIKRILSTVLVIAMLVTGMLATIPFGASAAEEKTSATVSVNPNSVELGEEEILALIKAYKEKSGFTSAADMLSAENPDYLDSISLGNDYILYINRYTGVVYYKNNITGEIIMSNPFDTDKNVKPEVLGQLTICYSTKSKPKEDRWEYSFDCINEGSFISVEKYGNDSIKVTYYLGEPESVHRVPDAIFSEDMGEWILKPMFEKFEQLMNKYVGEFPDASDSDYYKLSILGYVNAQGGDNLTSYNVYESDRNSLMFAGDLHGDMIAEAVNALTGYASAKIGNKKNPGYNPAAYKEISAFASNIKTIFSEYTLYNPDVLEDSEEKTETVKIWGETVPKFINEDGSYNNVFILDNKEVDQLKNSYRLVGKALKENLDFKAEKAEELNAKTGFEPLLKDLAVFECALIYSLDDDGSLVVDFPVSAFVYDKETFIVKSISYLQYFGYGNMNNDGYIFYPDGSGTIIDFDDFYKQNVQIGGDVFGRDFCYATIVDKHREQISMPVFGVVSTMTAADDAAGTPAVMGGYFAVIEQGASISKLRALTGGGYHDYATAYSEFTPLSYDTVDLKDVVSVGSSTSYIVVAESGYTGTHKTRYVQLTDPSLKAVADASKYDYYEASYIGMANYYRNYLKENGLIEKLKNTEKNMPLYIETLGAIDVTQRILTFPVAVSTPLTTFEDVQTMYNELSAKGVTNINFRLTGYSNGGMYFTYPAKVNWESSLGGDDGFEELLSFASSKSKAAGYNLGIYPDFDFQYINNTAAFDRVSNGANGSKFVDNRYATKQVYDSVSGLYETVYSVLVSANTLDELYEDFIDDYSEYSAKGISVSTLGSDLNSNFDDENTVDREASRKYVEALLGRMASKYSVMTDIGNAYTYKYIDHILNATIDASHLTQSSYAVPFFGMVLHGYVNYAGTPLNYTGSVDYNILKSVENGAALYYILCMQNTNYLKDDINLSKYYGVDYKNWFESVVKSYGILNEAIGGLQKYEIVNHTTLIAERIPNPSEYAEDLEDLLAEFAAEIEKQIAKDVSAKLANMRDNAQYGVGLTVEISKDEILAAAIEKFSYDADGTNTKLTNDDLSKNGFVALIDAIISKYEARYPVKDGAEVVKFDVAGVSYESKYTYSSDSLANAGDDYKYSDYTSDNGSVIAVTYKDTNPNSATYGDTVVFLINYNNYDVKVTIDGSIAPYLTEQKTFTVGKTGFYKV